MPRPFRVADQVPLISAESTSSQLSQQGGTYFFRTVPADNFQGAYLANLITQNTTKVGAMTCDEERPCLGAHATCVWVHGGACVHRVHMHVPVFRWMDVPACIVCA